jgi:hypothetical protein
VLVVRRLGGNADNPASALATAAAIGWLVERTHSVITPHYHAVRSWRADPDELDRRLILLPLFP